MSKTLLFEIGAVIFVALSTVVFLYGLAIFRDFQARDDIESAAELARIPVPGSTETDR